MRDNPNITAEELRKILGISKTAIENNISFLHENGYIERIRSKKAGYWNVLQLTTARRNDWKRQAFRGKPVLRRMYIFGKMKAEKRFGRILMYMPS